MFKKFCKQESEQKQEQEQEQICTIAECEILGTWMCVYVECPSDYQVGDQVAVKTHEGEKTLCKIKSIHLTKEHNIPKLMNTLHGWYSDFDECKERFGKIICKFDIDECIDLALIYAVKSEK